MPNKMRLSRRERIYVRQATISTKLKKEWVSKKVLEQALLDAYHGDETVVKDIDKMDAARSTRNTCLPFLSNSSVFIPWHTKVNVSKKLVRGSLLDSVIHYLEVAEKEQEKKNLGDTVPDSCSSMWYIDHKDPVVTDLSSAILEEYKRVMDNTGKKADIEYRHEVKEVFIEFVEANKVPSLVTYLKYEANKVQGCIEHRDADSIFCTAILIVQESRVGNLHVKNHNLPETLQAGDVVFMDPRIIHWVEKSAREVDRKVVVFTI